MLPFRILLIILLCGVAAPALAYIGPGSGLSLLGGLWSLLLGIVLALGAILMWPIRLLLRRLGITRPKRPEPRQTDSAMSDAESEIQESAPNRGGWGIPLLVLIALGVLALLGGSGTDTRPADTRFVVLGFDGMDPVLARRWIDEGKLPNFQALAQGGHFQPLGTSNPPQSPVAWSDFATGEHAGHHGIFDFLRRDPETYGPLFSISEDIPPESRLELFDMSIPLGGGEVLNRRQGQPFWSVVEDQGARASVLRVPVTYPPDDIHRMLSGMGVPDLLGTQGTYTLYSTTRLDPAGDSSRVIRVRPDMNGTIRTALQGPVDPLRPDDGALELPLEIAPAEAGAHVRLDEYEVELAPGEWSDWVTLNFDATGPIRIAGTARLLLVQGYPRPRLYVSPLQIDPREPAAPISAPPEYAAELAERIGLFHTLGMPEETWSLNEEHISDADWLAMERTILAEREAMWYDALDRGDSELVVGVFVQTDRVSHMFWRGLDPDHPRHADTAPEHRDAIEWIYREADRILGETLRRLGPNDELVVLSDHGFAPFRHAVHLNRWLVDQGYLVLRDGSTESDALFESIDWSRSRAYALGLNGVFINRAGREARGIVPPAKAEPLKAELAAALQRWSDPASGQPVIRRVFDADDVYPDSEHADETPDLVIGYHRGYRASWQTTLGAVPAALIEPNTQKWSGDHCIDPDLVPGVLFTNFGLTQPVDSLRDIRALAERRVIADSNDTPARERGLLDLPGVAFDRIDRALRGLLPAPLALIIWALLSAWATMAVYRATSNQARLAELKVHSRRLRREMAGWQGSFGGLLPLIGRNLKLSGQHLWLALGPALLAGLPVLLVLVWISGAYGPRAPVPNTAVEVSVTTDDAEALDTLQWSNARVESLDRDGEAARWRIDWPGHARPAILTNDAGRELARLPPTHPSPVLHPKKWWNTLIANPAGYLPDDSDIQSIRIEQRGSELLPLGPDWMRGWIFLYFAVLVLGAVALKVRWGVH